MNIDTIKQFVVLAKKKKDYEELLGQIKSDIVPLEQEILEDFCKEGVNQIKVDGRTVYMHIIEYAKKCEGITPQEAVAALEKAGLSEFINYNTMSLSGEMRRWQENAENIPLELKGVMEMVPTYSIRSRKS